MSKEFTSSLFVSTVFRNKELFEEEDELKLIILGQYLNLASGDLNANPDCNFNDEGEEAGGQGGRAKVTNNSR